MLSLTAILYVLSLPCRSRGGKFISTAVSFHLQCCGRCHTPCPDTSTSPEQPCITLPPVLPCNNTTCRGVVSEREGSQRLADREFEHFSSCCQTIHLHQSTTVYCRVPSIAAVLRCLGYTPALQAVCYAVCSVHISISWTGFGQQWVADVVVGASARYRIRLLCWHTADSHTTDVLLCF